MRQRPPFLITRTSAIFIFVLIFLVFHHAVGASYLTRPRLYLGPTTIPTLISRIDAVAGDDDNILTYYSDRILSTGDRWANTEPIPSLAEWAAKYDTHIRKYGNMLPDLALSYLLTGDDSYLNAALAWLDALCTYPNWGTDVDLGAAHVLFGFAVAFDWLSDSIGSSGGRRATYVGKISHHVGIFVGIMESDSEWWVDAYMQNHNFVDVTAMAVGARSIEGEAGVDAEMVGKATSLAFDNFGEVLKWLPSDGASQEGVAYWTYAIEALLRYFEVEKRRFGGRNRVREHAWFWQTGDYRLYTSVPPYYSDVVLVADGVPYDWYGPNYILHYLSSVFRRPVYEWLIDVSSKAKLETAGRSDIVEWRSLLWFDESVGSGSPAQLRYPLFHHFEDMGIYTSRSSWDVLSVGEKVGPVPITLFVTKAAPPGGHLAGYDCSGCGHVHPDAGSFILYYDGFPLIQDNGYSYWKKTWSHNIITFGEEGIGQYGEDSMWFSVSQYNAEEGHCEILKVENNDRSEYLVADLTRMYPLSVGLQLYRRHFVFVAKKYLLIADHVILEQPTLIKRHFHSEKTGSFSVLAGGILGYCYPNANVGYSLYDISPPAGTFLSEGPFDYSHTHEESGTTHEYHSLIANLTTPNAQDVVLFSLILPYRLENFTCRSFRQKLSGSVLTLWFDEDGVQITLDVPRMRMVENAQWIASATAVGSVLSVLAGIVFVGVLVVLVCITTGVASKIQCLKENSLGGGESGVEDTNAKSEGRL